MRDREERTRGEGQREDGEREEGRESGKGTEESVSCSYKILSGAL